MLAWRHERSVSLWPKLQIITYSWTKVRKHHVDSLKYEIDFRHFTHLISACSMDLNLQIHGREVKMWV